MTHETICLFQAQILPERWYLLVHDSLKDFDEILTFVLVPGGHPCAS